MPSAYTASKIRNYSVVTVSDIVVTKIDQNSDEEMKGKIEEE